MNNTALVQKMLQDVRNEIAEEKPVCNIESFESFWLRKHHANDSDFDKISLVNDLNVLENAGRINYYEELSSYKPGFSSVVIFVKKCIRKMQTFLILPMVEKQNAINSQNVRIAKHFRSFVNFQEENGRKLEVLSHNMKTDQEMMNSISAQLSAMNEQIRVLKEENDQLREQIKKIGG